MLERAQALVDFKRHHYEHADPITKQGMDADERKALMEANEARTRAMREAISSIARIANGHPFVAPYTAAACSCEKHRVP
jgi:hypothetical protein